VLLGLVMTSATTFSTKTCELRQQTDGARGVDRVLRPRSVPIISIPLAFRRPAASTVHAQTFQPRAAGARQGWPVRFDLALHRGAA
jgi:hypothetical protein